MIAIKPIGIVRSDLIDAIGSPIQPKASSEDGVIEIYSEYQLGLKDLEGFSHIMVLYHLHKIKEEKLTVIPFLDDTNHGVFATRSPSRPNRIGISVVELIKVEMNKLYVRGVDMLDNSPVIDIKPYIPEFDVHAVSRKGWFEKNINKINDTRDDGRFVD